MKIRITREQVEAVVLEIKRRHEIDARDAYMNNYDLPRELLLEKMQGMYGTLMAISENWPDVAFWLDEVWEEQGMDSYNEDYHASCDEPEIELKCENCCYFWQEEDEDRPACHWTVRAPGDVAPCDEEDYTEEDNDEEDWAASEGPYYTSDDVTYGEDSTFLWKINQ